MTMTMRIRMRALAAVASGAMAAALVAVLPVTPAFAGTSACSATATLEGGSTVPQNTTAISVLRHDIPSVVYVGSPARLVTLNSDSSIDQASSDTAWGFGARSITGSSDIVVVPSPATAQIPVHLIIAPANMTQGQATSLKASGTFTWTPPTTPQVVTFKTPDVNYRALTKFWSGTNGTGTLKIDVDADCNPAAEDVAGTPIRVMAKSTTTMGPLPTPITANSSNLVPVSVSVTGGAVSGKARLIVDGVERPLRTLSNGQGSLVLDGLSQGPHTVRAEFVPNDPNLYEGSFSEPVTIDVLPPATPTTTVLTLNKSTVSSSEPVIATATVSASSGSPAGQVIFSSDGVDKATVALPAGTTSVQASLSGLGTGAHDLIARFVPSAPLDYASSNSDIATVVVRAPATLTTTSVTVNKNPATTSDLITATATVGSATGAPSGTVQFFVDGVAVGGPTAVSGGVASRTLGRLSTPGARVITAEFTPANPAAYESSTGSVTVTVTAPGTPTSTTLALSPTSATSADTINATVTVTKSGGTPAGNVDILVDGVKVATGTLSGGVATVALPALGEGTRTVRAVFAPTDPMVDQASQSANQTVTITAVTSTTTLTLDPNSTSAGMDVTATASVVMSAGTAAGTVDFFVGGVKRGSATVGAGGTASLVLPPLDQGTYQITATFVPAKPSQQKGSSSAPSTLTLTQPVQATATTTTATLQEGTVTVADHARVDVTVAATNATPRGRVSTVVDGQTVTADLVNGHATLDLPLLAVGDYPFVVKFLPDNAQVFVASEAAPLTLHVVRAAATTQTDLTVTPSTAAAGESVTASALVTSSRGTPAGSVAFSVDGGAETTVALTGLTAEHTFAGLAAGPHTISARFVPTNRLNFAASTATPAAVAVLGTPRVATATGLTLTPGAAYENTPAHAVVTVKSDSGTPTGSVKVTMSAAGSPVEVLTGTLNASGTATITLPTYATGQFSIVADYQPTTGTLFDPSESAARPFTVAPAPPSGTATLTRAFVSPGQATVGDPVTATASVQWPGGFPAGMVRFRSNGVLIDTVPVVRGVASVSVPSTTPGSFSITAEFLSDNESVSTSSTSDPVLLRVVRGAPVLTMTTLSLNPDTVAVGEASVATAVVQSDHGTPQGSVAFSVDGVVTEVPLTGDHASLPLAGYDQGSFEIVAAFVPSAATLADFATSTSATSTFTVRAPAPQVTTATALSLSRDAAYVDEALSARLTVTAISGAVPTGQFVVKIGGATLRVPAVDGAALVSLPALAPGQYTVEASFEPDTGFARSSATPQKLTLTARPTVATAAPTTTALTLSTASPTLGSTLTATVHVTGATSGSVRFSTGWTSKTVPLSGGTAVAQLPVKAMGASTVSAVYVPASTTVASSFATASINVAKATTTVSVKPTFSASTRSLNVRIRVLAQGGTTCTGRVKLTVATGGKVLRIINSPVKCSGRLKRGFKVPKAKKYTIKVVYLGGPTTAPSQKTVTAKGR